MADGDITYLAWNDLVGLTRVRGVPSIEMRRRMEYGLGWAAAGQALTPFEHIAPNPWGPMLEVRQTPVPDTETKIDIWPDGIPLHFFLCDSMMPDGSTWECCTRGFMKQALAALKKETGLQFMGAFEQEFLLSGGGRVWWRRGGHFSGPLLANPHFRKVFLARTRELLDKTFKLGK